MFSIKEVPMPSRSGETVIVHFNNKDWYVRKVLSWVWDKETPLEQGYYEVILSRFNEEKVNPN